MKISFIVHLAGELEGRTKIVNKIKEGLEKRGHEVVFDELEADVIVIHSSGIASSFLLNKLKSRKKIYSLYSVGESNVFSTAICFLKEFSFHMKHMPITSLIKNFILYVTSASIPLKIKGYKLKQFDKVIVPSETIKKRLFKNTEVIHLGVDIEKFKPIEINNKQLIVGYVGHFGDFKGVYEVMKASAKFTDDIETHFYLNTFTKDGSIDELKKIIYKYNPKAKVFGRMDNMAEVYNSIDILVYPLKTPISAIANPLVLLEAMACGCAVITSNMPHIKEITTCEGAFLITPKIDWIVNAVDWLKSARLRDYVGKVARTRIVNEYNEQKMIEEYAKVIENV